MTRARAKTVSGAGKGGAVGAAGAAGLVASYFLDPDSGKRRRHIARDRALSLLRGGAETTRREAAYRTGQVEGKVEAVKSKARPEKPASTDQTLTERDAKTGSTGDLAAAGPRGVTDSPARVARSDTFPRN